MLGKRQKPRMRWLPAQPRKALGILRAAKGKRLRTTAKLERIAGPVGTLIGSLTHRKKIRNAAALLGRALEKEAREDRRFRGLLNRYRYVTIDGLGNLSFTNMPKPPFGRIRLESQKILDRRYSEELGLEETLSVRGKKKQKLAF